MDHQGDCFPVLPNSDRPMQVTSRAGSQMRAFNKRHPLSRPRLTLLPPNHHCQPSNSEPDLALLNSESKLSHIKLQQRWASLASSSQILFILLTVILMISSAANQTLVTAKRSTRTYLNPLISLSGASRYSNFASARHFYPQVSSRTAYKLIDDSDTGSASSNHSQGDKQEERPSLTLISSQVDELKRLLEAKLEHLNSRLTENTTSALVKLGSPCLRAHHCSAHIKGAHCRSEDFTCACLPQHVQYNSTFCLAPGLLGSECLVDSQCQQRVPNSYCHPEKRTCTCPDSFVTYRRDRCLGASRLEDYCLTDSQCQLADRHSFCKWKIPNIYGLCRCPINYKLISNYGQTNGSKCAPRLGDACLDDDECLLATSNSVCLDSSSASARQAWTTSTASSRRCRCASGYAESSNRLSCERPLVSLSTVASMSAQNQYELVASSANGSSSSPRAPELVSSLGKPCSSGRECKARDPNSDCIAGKCECLRPTRSCSSNSTGCHKDTFQCRSGQCISWYFVCDQFKNCPDGSDEESCGLRFGCPPEAFQCLDGSCIARGQLCNGRPECPDGSDELQCTARPSLAAPAAANQSAALPSSGGRVQPGRCHPRAFECANGQCLPSYVFCNAVEDCSDGSDEREQLCEPSSSSPSSPASSLPSSPPSSPPRLQTASQPSKQPDADNDDERRKSAPSASNSNSSPAEQRRHAGHRDSAGHKKGANQSPLVKVDRESINRMLAKLNLTPQRRPRRAKLVPEQQPDAGECPRWAFTCRNGKCRSSAILCSGVDGCGDQSDEQQCEVCMCAPV